VPVLVLVTQTLAPGDLRYKGMVLEALMAGGCNSSRCSLVGAVMAALEPDSVPKAWIDKTKRGADVVDYAEKLVAFG